MAKQPERYDEIRNSILTQTTPAFLLISPWMALRCVLHRPQKGTFLLLDGMKKFLPTAWMNLIWSAEGV